MSAIFHVLGHPTKLRILHHVMSVGILQTGELNYDSVVPTLVATELDMPVAQASYSLKRMSEAGILSRNVSGRYTFYRIDPNFVSIVKEFFNL